MFFCSDTVVGSVAGGDMSGGLRSCSKRKTGVPCDAPSLPSEGVAGTGTIRDIRGKPNHCTTKPVAIAPQKSLTSTLTKNWAEARRESNILTMLVKSTAMQA